MKRWVSAFLGWSMIVTGCSVSSTGGGETIKIGEIGTETGSLAASSKPLMNGTALAIEHFNAAGGYNGRKVEIVRCNDEGNPEKGLSCARRLVEQDKVAALLGPHFSGVFKAAAPVFNKSVFGVTSTPHVTLDGTVFTFQTSGPTFLPATVAFTYFKNKGWTKVGFLAGQDESGATALKNVEPIAKSLGLELLVERFDPKDVNVTAQLTRLRSQQPNVVMVWDTGAHVANVVKAYSQLGMDAPFVMNYGNMSGPFMALLKGSEPKTLLVPAAEFVDPSSITNATKKALVEKVYTDYKAKFNADADFLAAQGYDAAVVLLTALKAVGPDSTKMKEYLEKGGTIQGVNWTNKYSATNHSGPTNHDAMVMVQWIDGNWKTVK